MLTVEFSLAKMGEPIRETAAYREYDVEGIRVVRFRIPYEQRFGARQRIKTFFSWARAILRYMRANDFDVMIGSSTPITTGLPGVLMKMGLTRRRRKFIFESRDLWSVMMMDMGVVRNRTFGELLRRFEIRCYTSADGCIAVAPGIVDDMIKAGVSPDRVHLIPNGSDWTPLPRETSADGKWTAVFAGMHGKAGGLDSILDAAAELKARGVEDVRIVLIGSGEQKPRLQQRAKGEKLDNVEFLQPLPRAELRRLFRGCDVALMCLAPYASYSFGTSPNKFADYLNAGIPVVVNYPGWTADLVRENRCGITVPPNDSKALADALLKLRDDSALADTMRSNASKLGLEDFHYDILGPRFVDAVEYLSQP